MLVASCAFCPFFNVAIFGFDEVYLVGCFQVLSPIFCKKYSSGGVDLLLWCDT